MTGVRVAIALIITAIVAVALVPMFVLVDLVGGGDGWGMCANGLASCRTSYFDGPELLAGLTVFIFLLLMLLRGAFHIQRMMVLRERAEIERSARRGQPVRRP